VGFVPGLGGNPIGAAYQREEWQAFCRRGAGRAASIAS
jgi:hypothetical protein